MITKQYQVISIDERNNKYVEAIHFSEKDAFHAAECLANDYGPTEKQDKENGYRIVEVTVRPVWILNENR